MRIGEKYRPERLNPPYDAIVIGSGIGGLCTAALLSKSGKKVLVLERHYMPGGFTHAYLRKGYEWDVGIHYIGEVHRPTSILRLIFDHISNGELKWEFMGDVYDRLVFGEDRYDFHAGKKNWLEGLLNHFPKERAALERYLELVESVNTATQTFFGERALPPLLGKVLQPWMGKKFLALSDRTVDDVLRELTQDERLRGVLSGQWGDYGLPPRQASFAIHALVVKHYLAGGSYPVGGASSLARTIEPVIQQSGGQLLHTAEVQQILVHQGRAIGVRLADGQEIQAPCIISNAGVLNTYQKLLPSEVAQQYDLLPKLEQVQYSLAHLCMYIGLAHSAQELGLEKTNYWIYPGYDHDRNIAQYLADPSQPLPTTYISFPSTKDPTWEERYPNKSTIEIVSFAPYDWFQAWEAQPWRKRGADYEALKQSYAERMQEQLFRFVPQVQGKIDYYEVSTPLSTRTFMGYDHGEIYGIEHTPHRFRQRWLRPQTPISQLYLTGQDIVTNGIGGALMAGVLTASAILKGNLLKGILAKRPRS